MTLAEQIVSAAKAQGISIATAESCTGGMVAASLTDVPGSSAAFECGFVTYSNAAKQKILGVLPETLDAHGAVSEPVALEMAQGAIDASQATLSVAITGIAGPGGSDHKPEGRVCFAVAQSGLDATSQTIEFGALGRAQVRAAAREHAKHLLLAAMTP
ncbi:CinA family protein [Ascidiaceihabitans sp.]|uniref:CinA family protein n=1 Tax=Ascidiaceihabitans sp. TaxID=1872644 RepID=UPI003296A0AE